MNKWTVTVDGERRTPRVVEAIEVRAGSREEAVDKAFEIFEKRHPELNEVGCSEVAQVRCASAKRAGK